MSKVNVLIVKIVLNNEIVIKQNVLRKLIYKIGHVLLVSCYLRTSFIIKIIQFTDKIIWNVLCCFIATKYLLF